jgi:RimJ/RimL family protein N-acetyltransferase
LNADVALREVHDADLPVFYAHQLDAGACHMAAFTSDDPTDKEMFDAHWTRIRSMPSVRVRTVLHRGEVAGHIAQFERDGTPEVTYWIGREHWGKQVATAALAQLLDEFPARPIYARAARDNVASIRVLEKCGFAVDGHDRGFANARGEEIDEVVMKLA